MYYFWKKKNKNEITNKNWTLGKMKCKTQSMTFAQTVGCLQKYILFDLILSYPSRLTDEEWDLYTLKELAEELPLANCRGSSKNQPFRCGSFPKFHRSWCVCAQSLQSCLTLCDPVAWPMTVSSVHEILQARILEWVAVPPSRGSSPPRDWTCVSCIAGRLFTTEPPGKHIVLGNERNIIQEVSHSVVRETSHRLSVQGRVFFFYFHFFPKHTSPLSAELLHRL